MTAPSDTSIKDFEAAIAELESIVKKLEEGDLALEQSLALYERGVQLSRFCHSTPRRRRTPHRDPERARRTEAGAGDIVQRRRTRALTGP